MKGARGLETLTISKRDDQEIDDVVIHAMLQMINPTSETLWKCSANFLDSLRAQQLSDLRLDRIFVSTDDFAKLFCKVANTLTALKMDKVVLDGNLRALKTLRLDRLQHLEMIGVKAIRHQGKYISTTGFLRSLGHDVWNIERPSASQATCAIKPGTNPTLCLRHDPTRARNWINATLPG
jgi:hypothetical protein